MELYEVWASAGDLAVRVTAHPLPREVAGLLGMFWANAGYAVRIDVAVSL